MYNEKRKEDYIEYKNSIKTSIGSLRSFFRRAGMEEEKLGKDLCEWSAKEIVSYCKSLNNSKINTLLSLVNGFSLYTDWCIENNLSICGQNHYYEVDPQTLVKECLYKEEIRRHIISRETLLSEITGLLNYSDKFLILGTFEGLTTKELSEAKAKDLHGNTFTTSSRVIEVSDELKEIIEKTKGEDVRYVDAYGKGIMKMELVEGDEIIRPVVERIGTVQDNASVFVTNRFVKAANQIELGYNFTDIRDSGRLHLIKELMEENNTTFRGILVTPRYREIVEGRYGRIQNRSVFQYTYEDMMDLV